MEGPPLTAGLEELLAHRAWVRRVARALVLDESRADDLEQETWVRVLRKPPPHPARAWLGTVLWNAASEMRRGERRWLERNRPTDPIAGRPWRADVGVRVSGAGRRPMRAG